MKTIWKFETLKNGNWLGISGEFICEMPVGANIISAGIDPGGQPCLWAEVDPQADVEPRRFYKAGTGNSVPANAGRFIGSVT